MGARSRFVRLLPWVLALALLPFILSALPGATSHDPAPALTGLSRNGPPTIADDAASRLAGAQPISSRQERPISDDEQRRLMMYLILRSATGRYPFAHLR
jgi:hypothetical protein